MLLVIAALICGALLLWTARGAEVEIVGEAGTVDDALAVIRGERPDVVLLDVHMPDGGGLAVLEA